MKEKLQALKKRLAQLSDLDGVMVLQLWDQEVYMPPAGAQTRSDQTATVGAILHELNTSPELGALLEDLLPYADELDPDSDTARMIMNNWRDYQKRVRLPSDLMERYYGVTSMSRQMWKGARENDDYASFIPHLQNVIDVQLEMAEHLDTGDGKTAYDVLIDYFEPGITSVEIDEVFSSIKPGLIDLVHRISETDPVDDSMMTGHFDAETQIAFDRTLAEQIGYSFESGRMDMAPHPFTESQSHDDVRITTRVSESFRPSCLFAVLHEGGHGIHGQKCSPDLYQTRTTIPSLAICESQSRFYENIIGRSRPFWEHNFPRLAEAFPSFKGIAFEDFYRAINRVKPSLIRIEADEVTYGMHIMLRFDLERAVLGGELGLEDLPAAWNAKMEEYLGVTSPNDAKGVLQDIHWSMMPMGYFPAYLLGSIFSAQAWDALKADNPDAESQIAKGDMSQINDWTCEKIQKHGGKFTLNEIAERATGEKLNASHYMSYLTGKYSAIYGL